MSRKLEDLEPAALWGHFFSICSIPHASRGEAALAAWLGDWAKRRGIACESDETGNVIMRAPAAPGCEGRPGIVLQAHLDMVAQAAPGSAHDFARDPIRPRLDPADPDWLTADGTTLGADDGLGVAAAMALLEDASLRRGPLECLFTVNEEDGMDGARAVAPGTLSGRYLINLDGEDAGEITIGCSGMLRTAAKASFRAEPPPDGYRWADASLAGLVGGHSGIDIHLGRGNAIVALARVLGSGRADGLSLASLEGGGAANAIPREAMATVGLPKSDFDAWKAEAEGRLELARGELGAADPGLSFGLSERGAPASCLSAADSSRLLAALTGLPNGCMQMEPSMPDVTRTSSNLGCVSLRAEGGRMELGTLALARSSVESEKQRVGREIEAALAELGAESSRPSESPAWKPEPTSLLLSLAVDEYRGAFGRAPRISSTHSGLECGIFRSSYPDWEMIAIGPTIRWPHSPDERVSVPSAQKFWKFLAALVSRLR